MHEPFAAYDRNTQTLMPQKTVADGWMKWIYETQPGRMALGALVKRKAVSSLYGWYCKRRASAKMAQKLIDQYEIDVTPFATPFRTYRDFFTRRLPYVPMPKQPEVLGAWAEGYASAWQNIDPRCLIQVKGMEYDLADLLCDGALAEKYAGGTMIRIRLAPQHYHHFHWFDGGVVQQVRDIKGQYYSVHPLALGRIAALYCQNKRRAVQVKTDQFGSVLLVEVGATMIGSILNPFSEGSAVKRGEDGGYFAPGGSMILGLFEKDAIQADEDLLCQTQAGRECIVHLGERLAVKG